LGCSIEYKLKGLKDGATWRDSEILREFMNLGLWRIVIQKGEGTFNAEAPNTELPSNSLLNEYRVSLLYWTVDEPSLWM
jgi:hypothetical protein